MIREIGSDGLTEGERTVLDLWDAGLPFADVVARTGRTDDFVQRILTLYATDDWFAPRHAAAAANARFLAALAASGGRFA